MLDIQNLSKTFNPGTVNEKKALSSLSLHLDEGDFVTIVGSNGAGKSTLFNAIAGSFFVDTGAVRLDGEDITFMPEHDDRRKPCARVPARGARQSVQPHQQEGQGVLRRAAQAARHGP